MNYININNKGEAVFSSSYPIVNKELKLIQTEEDIINKIYSFDKGSFEYDINLLKQSKIKEIETEYSKEVKNLSFKSTIINIEINCRRFKHINDLQDLDILIRNSKRIKEYTVRYHGKYESIFVNIELLEQVLEEMIDRLSKLKNKRDVMIDNCKNINDIIMFENISWN